MSSGAPVEFDCLLSVAQARRALGVGRTTFYGLIKENRVPVVKIGRRTLISARQVQLFIDRLSNQGRGPDDCDDA
jgi:excisionase family DNA binding protein